MYNSLKPIFDIQKLTCHGYGNYALQVVIVIKILIRVKFEDLKMHVILKKFKCLLELINQKILRAGLLHSQHRVEIKLAYLKLV